ncbi:hypothetical protein PTKIN_Ptkin01aG0152500 [Pterospermum kingtungense]
MPNITQKFVYGNNQPFHAMTWVLRKKQMKLRRGLACLSLLLLLLLQFETCPCYAGVHDKLNRFKAGSGGGPSPNLKSYQGKVVGDGIFGAERRKVSTGPNPLHNR